MDIACSNVYISEQCYEGDESPDTVKSWHFRVSLHTSSTLLLLLPVHHNSQRKNFSMIQQQNA